VYADFRCPLGSSGHSVDVYQKYAIYTWHYHRIIDCFLPLLPLLHRVHNDISRGHGRNLVVLVQNHSVGDFLGEWTRLPRVELSDELPRSRLPLVPRSWTVDKATAPTNLTPSNLRGRPAEELLALPGCCPRPPSASELLRRYTTHWLGVPPPPRAGAVAPRTTLLVHRGTTGSGFRLWERSSYERLRWELRRAHGALLRVHTGRERLLDQLRLFARAESIVGYHGGAFAALAFSRRACVHEVSTFARVGSVDPRDMWRSNREPLLAHAPLLSWHVHLLPLSQMLQASPHNYFWRNGTWTSRWGRIDGQIRHKCVPLSDAQVGALVRSIGACSLAVRSGGLPAHSRSLLGPQRDPASQAISGSMCGLLNGTVVF